MSRAVIPTDERRGAGGIPEAWPALLTREQVCAYLGMSPESFATACAVAPVVLGVKLLRWRRADIDDWVAGLPSRLRRSSDRESDEAVEAPQPFKIASEERRLSAMANATKRAARKPERRACKKN